MAVAKIYTEFGLLLKRTVDYLMANDGTATENATRLGIGIDEINSISTSYIAFQLAYDTYADPATQTKIATAAVKTEYDKILPIFSKFQQRLKNGLAELTDEDYAVLEIHKDKTTRTPKTIPTTVPMPFLVKAEKRFLTIEGIEQQAEAINRLAVPAGCVIAIQLAVVAQGESPTKADYETREPSGKARFRLEFAANEAGNDVYIILAYQNTAGRGPWSQPLKAIII